MPWAEDRLRRASVPFRWHRERADADDIRFLLFEHRTIVGIALGNPELILKRLQVSFMDVGGRDKLEARIGLDHAGVGISDLMPTTFGPCLGGRSNADDDATVCICHVITIESFGRSASGLS